VVASKIAVVIRLNPTRRPDCRRYFFLWTLGCLTYALVLAHGVAGATAQELSPAEGNPAATAQADVAGHPAESTPSKHQVRDAETAYLAGAKKLQRDDLDGADQEFQRALKLNPENRYYAMAISMAREHKVNELVQQASKARLAGDDKSAETLLTAARTIDPDNQMVIEHSGPFVRAAATGQAKTNGTLGTPIADRTLMLANAQAGAGWRIQSPVLAGAIQLKPDQSTKDFDLRGTSADLLRNVALAYGINAIIDDSVEPKSLHFNLQHATYEQATSTLISMTHVFSVPVDETSEIIADDTPANRQRLERQLQETIYVPGLTTEQINELAQVVRSVFDVKQATIETGLGALVIRAPQDILDPLNLTLKDLIDGSGEVMVEVKLYEVDITHDTTAGATIPQQFSVFNVDQAANQIVNSNQALVQQAIAQGYVTAGTSNLEIALALIDLGLVKSNLATNLIGVFGGGLLRTGVSGSTNATFNLSLNSTDTRSLDDVQIRAGDHQTTTFREGEKYPITQSTYSSGLSTAAAAVGNATINGVSVSSLLSQFAGGTNATIPQVTYEDLGLTLKATPVIEKSNRVNLMLDLKIEALSGTSLDGNPVLDSRQFSTDLTVADGESAMLVSNMTRSESAAMTGLPGLSELPGFQLPLEDTTDRDSSQLVVVVTPHIVRRRSNVVEGPRIPMAGPLDN
jgi:general secretion pathway protein D